MSSNIDIRPDHLEIVHRILREHLPRDVKVWAFGSRATWKAKDYSDLDLALEGKEKLPRNVMTDLEYAFEESDLPWKVDILDVHNTTPAFLEAIERDKVALPLNAQSGGGVMSEWLLEDANIALIDGDRGTNYPKQHEFQQEGYCLFLSAKNVTNSGFVFADPIFISKERDEKLRAGKLTRGDIVVTTRGTIGNVAYYDESVLYENIRINSGMMIFRADESVWNRRFLYFVLVSNVVQNQIKSLTSGSAVPQLPARDLKKFILPKVSKGIQNKIAKIIGDLDDKIAMNQQINQTLEAMAQACFKSWFVDFEPTRAKMAALAAGGTGEDATFAAMSAISGQPRETLATLKTTNPEAYAELHKTASLFPSSLVDSELGEIPEGWEVSEIGKEVAVVGGGTPSTKKPEFWEDGDIPWTTPKDLSNLNDKVLIDTDRKITKLGLAKISSGLLPVNTVLMSSRAPVGYLALAKVPVAVNQGYIAMKCEKNLTPEYVLQWCAANMEDIKLRASGTTFAEISKSTFRPMAVLVPETEMLHAYSRQVAAIYSQIETLVRENHALASMRDALLPKLLSGEISVDGTPHTTEAA